MDTDQSQHVSVHEIDPDLIVSSDLDNSLSISGAPPEGWTDQWITAQLTLGAIERATDADTFRSLVESFFAACRRISDGVEAAPELPTIDQGAINDLLKSSLPITVGHLIASKSERRTLSLRSSAKIERISARQGVWRASIIYVADERTHTFDSFALATECLDDWRAFLISHGATPPELG